MKIVILSDYFPPAVLGGAEMIAYRSAVGLARRGHAVTVITTSSSQKSVERTHREGLEVITIPSAVSPRLRSWLGAYHPAAIRQVQKILSAERPDVVHGHNLHTQLSFGVLRVAGYYTPRVFLTAHDPLLVHYDKFSEAVDPTDISPRPRVREQVTLVDQLRAARWRFNPFRGSVIRWALGSVTRVFAVSEALGRILTASGVKRVSTLHNGISADEFRLDPSRMAELRTRLGVGERPVILFAGRATRTKGVAVLLEVFQRIVDHPRRPVLLIADPRTDKAGQNTSVIQASFTAEEMPSVYGCAAFAVVPSIYPDPFPTVNLEAGAAGRAVVGTCFGGTPEVVVDGDTGIIINPFNRDAFTHAMRRLLDQPDEAAVMGERACTRIAEHFTLDQQLDALLAWYRGESVAAHNISLVS